MEEIKDIGQVAIISATESFLAKSLISKFKSNDIPTVFLHANIREIEEALLKNDDILSVESIDISRNRKTLSVNISITSTYGKESAVVNI